jgi:hypothetical protein
MMRQFPQTASATELIALYRACADNLPIAVINEVGEFLGSVEPSAIWRRVAVGLEDEH